MARSFYVAGEPLTIGPFGHSYKPLQGPWPSGDSLPGRSSSGRTALKRLTERETFAQFTLPFCEFALVKPNT